jgi:hypothetical protein
MVYPKVAIPLPLGGNTMSDKQKYVSDEPSFKKYISSATIYIALITVISLVGILLVQQAKAGEVQPGTIIEQQVEPGFYEKCRDWVYDVYNDILIQYNTILKEMEDEEEANSKKDGVPEQEQTPVSEVKGQTQKASYGWEVSGVKK